MMRFISVIIVSSLFYYLFSYFIGLFSLCILGRMVGLIQFIQVFSLLLTFFTLVT